MKKVSLYNIQKDKIECDNYKLVVDFIKAFVFGCEVDNDYNNYENVDFFLNSSNSIEDGENAVVRISFSLFSEFLNSCNYEMIVEIIELENLDYLYNSLQNILANTKPMLLIETNNLDKTLKDSFFRTNKFYYGIRENKNLKTNYKIMILYSFN